MSELPADHFTKKRAFTQKVYRDEYPAISPEQAKLSQEGKVIVITGASQGIGSKGFAKQFLRASPKAIVLAARNPEKLAETKDMLMTLDKPEVEIQLVPTDISNPKEVVALFKTIEDTYGHADVLVNNAGVYECFPDRIGDAKLEDWWNGFEINVKGSFLITQQFLRLLGQKPGTIINLSSYSALYMDPGESAYALSKLVNLQMATTIAIEYPNVVSVSMNPGMVESPMTLEPFRRFSRDTPELAGGVAVWLASKEGEFMNGRFMDTNWDVEELVERRNEIVKTDLFKLGLRGTESGLLR